jgi:hypothetical protein
MQVQDTEVIPRIPGLSNKEMLDRCIVSRDICLKTVDVKVGRGKGIEVVKKLRYNTPPDALSLIIKSCEHYERLHKQDLDRMERVTLREYQSEIITKGVQVMYKHRFLYLAMEVRTGKTLTSLAIAEKLRVSNVLFVTKKKAISSIEDDYKLFGPSYSMLVINYESLHLVQDERKWDLVILDEAHSMGAFPKPSQRATTVKDIVKKYNPYVILLSGTPTPESYSQMYHQVYAIPNNPFSEFKNFYRFADVYVKVTDKKIGGMMIKDYSKGQATIVDKMAPYTINYTQVEAGFKVQITENIIEVEMKQSTYNLIEKLKKDLVVVGKEETLLADTAVKLMSKVHQLYSGTVKFESGNSMVIDTTKAEFILSQFATAKIGIFYKFKEELEALKSVFKDKLTTDISEFDDTSKSIALQIVSGREGISLRNADYLVYYNIDFSATSYWQSRDRMTTKDRGNNTVYWVFSKGGIEKDIYKAVSKKKDYTINHFKKDISSK